jgi:hypothetical protein
MQDTAALATNSDVTIKSSLRKKRGLMLHLCCLATTNSTYGMQHCWQLLVGKFLSDHEYRWTWLGLFAHQFVQRTASFQL